MKYYAVILEMLDKEKSHKYRPQHLAFLAEGRKSGKILANGRFLDGAGGLVIYTTNSYEETESLVKQDPYIIAGARDYHIHEWEMVSDVLVGKNE